MRITPTVAKAMKNGSELAGAWEVRSGSDAGALAGLMNLRREGSTVTGTSSGALGEGRAVSGTWREGYVELRFAGEWPRGRQGAPGPVTALLAGWIDGDSAKGRMRVEGRADGAWMAKRTE